MDGELDANSAESVRVHLADCASCQEWFGDLLQLDALAERYGAELRRDGALAMAEDAALRKDLRLTPGRDLLLATVAVVLSLGALVAVLVWWWAQ